MIEQYPLPYIQHGSLLMGRLRELPWACWLDSGRPRAAGRYDIFVAAPAQTVVSEGGYAVLRDRHGQVQASSADERGLLRELMRARRRAPVGLPFAGGMLGYFSYDLGRRWQGVPSRWPDEGLPELAVGLYDWAVVTDHARQETVWAGSSEARPARDWVVSALTRPVKALPPAALGEAVSDPGREAYAERFARLLAYIRDGDCYQANLARRFTASLDGDPWATYLRLRELTPAPFSAYLELPFAQVLSFSPERFLRIAGGEILTQPIKGTRPRGGEPEADRREAEALLSSTKDRAENVMIVDLLRNDLGKVCRAGSVRVSRLCALESFASVHHLVSEVRGMLREDADAFDALAACLPGGSITGAPKRRAMEIIDELEPARRGIYCGAIGYLADHGDFDSSIAIRTATVRGGRLSYWAGGGIVVDSDLDAEFEETRHKARAFLDLAGSVAGE